MCALAKPCAIMKTKKHGEGEPDMSELYNLGLLNGFMCNIPILSGKITVYNIQYLESTQNIYQAPICCDYSILYFFLNASQTVELYAPERISITVPKHYVFAVREKLRHRFCFMPGTRPCALMIYYQVLFSPSDPDVIECIREDEVDLIRSFQQQPYSLIPINDRMMQELEMMDDYLRTSTKGDVIKLRNQLSNILLSVFQQNRFERGDNYEEKLQQSTNRNIHFALLNCLQERFFQGIPLDQVSDELHYTPRHVQRLISRYFGESFSHVMLNFQVSYMMALLHDTDLSLHEICEKVGFANEKAMFQGFKAVTGTSPTQFRKLCVPLKERREM